MNENLELVSIACLSKTLHYHSRQKKVRDVKEAIQPGRMFFFHEQK